MKCEVVLKVILCRFFTAMYQNRPKANTLKRLRLKIEKWNHNNSFEMDNLMGEIKALKDFMPLVLWNASDL